MSASTTAVIERRDTTFTDAAVREVLEAHLAEEFAALPDAIAHSLIAMQLQARLGAFRTSYPDALAWVLEERGHPLGYAIVDDAEHLRLVDLLVRPTARRRGLASGVLAELCAIADASGREICLSVQPGSDAERLYLRHGFETANRDDDDMHRAMSRRSAMEGRR